jgi:hypothetical protein
MFRQCHEMPLSARWVELVNNTKFGATHDRSGPIARRVLRHSDSVFF